MSNLNKKIKNKHKETVVQLKLMKEVFFNNIRTPYIGWLGYQNLGDEILFDAYRKLFPQLNLVQYQRSNLIDLYSNLRGVPVYKYAVLGGGTLINQPHGVLDEVQYLLNQKVKMFCFGTGVIDNSYLKTYDSNWVDDSEQWRKTLEEFLFVGVRGPYSKRLLEEIGFNKAVIVGDTALALAPEVYNKENSTRIIGVNFGLNKIQTVWGDQRQYLNEFVILIKELINKGYKVHLLPIFKQDIESNQNLHMLVNNENCKLIINYSTLNDYSIEVNKCDVFVGQKLHSTIIACMNRIPSVMVEYNPKCRDFMASIDMEDYTLKTSDFEANKVISLIKDLLLNREKVREKLDHKIMKFKKIQADNASTIIDQIL